MNFYCARVAEGLAHPQELLLVALLAQSVLLAHPFEVHFFLFLVDAFFGQCIHVFTFYAFGCFHVFPPANEVSDEAKFTLP